MLTIALLGMIFGRLQWFFLTGRPFLGLGRSGENQALFMGLIRLMGLFTTILMGCEIGSSGERVVNMMQELDLTLGMIGM